MLQRRMKMNIYRPLVPLVALMAWIGMPAASAHIFYTGRDFGTIAESTPAVTISSNVGSGLGWAEATTATWGDSHSGRFFRFSLTETMSIGITVERSDPESGFLPAFSLYEGLAHLAPLKPAHDGSALSVASRPAGMTGSFRALNDWSIGNDPAYVVDGDPGSGILYGASLKHFTYIGHAADGTSGNFGDADGILGDGIADGWVTGIFENLAPGDYSIFIGGADFGGAVGSYNFDVTMTAIPEPSTYAIGLGSAVFGLLLVRRFRRG
jgi:hypothetical protein